MKQADSNGVLDNLHLKEVKNLMRDMKYGSITIVVQDEKIIQIEKTEKYRIKD